MRIGIEFEAFKAVTMEGIAEFHAAQVKADMNGPLADVCCLVGGVVGGFMVYPFRRVVTASLQRRLFNKVHLEPPPSRWDSLTPNLFCHILKIWLLIGN